MKPNEKNPKGNVNDPRNQGWKDPNQKKITEPEKTDKENPLKKKEQPRTDPEMSDRETTPTEKERKSNVEKYKGTRNETPQTGSEEKERSAESREQRKEEEE